MSNVFYREKCLVRNDLLIVFTVSLGYIGLISPAFTRLTSCAAFF